MKDYTKYDFAAIKGAYVEMEIAPTEDPAIHATINGMVVYQDPTSILVLRKSGTVTCFLRSEIVPGSLSARIKVEDMSLKQLIRMMDRMKYTNPKFDENGIWFECSNGDKAVARFGKYIDCTDWGWKR